MIDQVLRTGLLVQPPNVTGGLDLPTLQLTNLNPQCGSFPLGKSTMKIDGTRYAAFRSEVTSDFIRSQIKPRGRPHWSLIHCALLDDAVASLSTTAFTGQPYGSMRYLELGVVVVFHREAFVTGSLSKLPRHAIEVDGFRIYWECIADPGRSLLARGIFRVAVRGLIGAEEVPVASIEGRYLKAHGVSSISN